MTRVDGRQVAWGKVQPETWEQKRDSDEMTSAVDQLWSLGRLKQALKSGRLDRPTDRREYILGRARGGKSKATPREHRAGSSCHVM